MSRDTPRLRPPLAAGLHWVRRELEQSLAHARQLIEQHSEFPDDVLPLQQAIAELHQARGTASMLQCYGAAALADEMKEALQDLLRRQLREPELAYSALVGAALQLSDYIEALAAGQSDCALVLQPVFNELRLVRGKPVFTEQDLFVSQMSALAPMPPLPGAPRPAEGAAQAQARRLLSTYQAALLQWLKGADVPTQLGRIGKIAEHVAAQAALAPVHHLWRTVAGCVEALLTQSLEDSFDLKRLFGRAGQQLRQLAAGGEPAAAEAAGDLLYRLLFHAGRSHGQGARVSALRQDFGLAIHLPDAAALEQLRRRLRGANTQLLDRVANEIRADLAQVKDSIDLAVRSGARSSLDLAPTRERLDRISGTLMVLGLPVLQRVIGQQARVLETLRPHDAGAPQTWMDLATAVLRVEHSLEDALFRQLRRLPSGAAAAELDEEVPQLSSLREGTAALLRESLVNLARLKACVDAFIRSGDASGLTGGVRLLKEIAAGFRMLDRERAAQLIERLCGFLQSPRLAAIAREPALAERFADAVAAVEFYIEAQRDRLPAADQLLDDLSGFLERLEPAEAVAALSASPPAPVERSFECAEPAALAATQPLAEPSAAGAPAAPEQAPVDPEIRATFIAEADEVLRALQRALPRLRRDPGDREALAAVRRAFHTLKGSGRMAGAAQIGDFGWAVERMLNRCLDGAIEVGPRVVDTVTEAVQMLPGLLAAYRDDLPQDGPHRALCERAQALADGHEDGAPDILAVFRHDALGRLDVVTRWLDELERRQAPEAVPAEVARAFHTLRGAAQVVNAPAVGALAAAIETYLDAVRSARLALSGDGLQLLDEAARALRGWIAQAGEPGAAPDAQGWIERLERLQSGVPEHLRDRAARAAADRQLAEVFAGEAFEILRRLEETLGAWARAPDARVHARELKSQLQTLHGAALMASCRPIADVTLALQARMDGFTAGRPPSRSFFAAFGAIVERYYQALDEYREQGLRRELSELAAQIQALDAAAPEPAPEAPEPLPAVAPVAPPADGELIELSADALGRLGSSEPEAPAAGTDDWGLALRSTESAAEPAPGEDWGIELRFEPEPAEALPAAEGADDSLPSGHPQDLVPNLQAGAVQEVIGQRFEPELIDALPPALPPELPPEPRSLQGESVAAPATAGDTRPAPRPNGDALTGLFLSQAETLLEDIDRWSAALEAQPDDAEAAGQLRNALQSLHGDARSAGFEAVGEVAQRLQQRLARVHAGAAADPRLLGELQNAADGLLAMLAQIRSGAVPDAGALLAGLDTASLPEPVPASAHEAAAPADNAGLDRELAQIFTAEAGELLESLDGALRAWRDRGDHDALREVQRALHTLKGGARMAGLTVMGSAAHEMESQVNALESGRTRGEPERVQQLFEQLEALQRMHDRLSRGDIAPLTAPPAAAAEPLLQGPPASDASRWDTQLFWKPADPTAGAQTPRRETARVPVESLDAMLNQAGEISIYRSRLEEHNASLRNALGEVSQTIARMREQLRQMDIETEAQIAARGLLRGAEHDRYESEFDPLEMDRYSHMQELSRALAESVGDLASLHGSVDELVDETETLLQQQGRVNTELQTGLMSSLMVPFARLVQRLQRLVRQTAEENGRQAEVEFSGIQSELDRNVLERMTGPLEHLLRNSVVHGIEPPQARVAAGKPAMGTINVALRREGTQLAIELSDDGRGLDIDAIRHTAVRRGLIPENAPLRDDDIAQFVFAPGFSTARSLTHDAGRGIGMDVVASEVRQLGGALELRSEAGRGVRFVIRLPLSLTVSQALLVGVADELYAVPLPAIEGIVRIAREQLAEHYRDTGAPLHYGGHDYGVRYLGDFIGVPRRAQTYTRAVSAILVCTPEGLSGGERRVAVVVDRLLGKREVISKAAGPLVSSIVGVSGATILADGQVVLMLDVAALAQDHARRALLTQAGRAGSSQDERDLVMVVDDSITMRRVAERLLLRSGYRVSTAKDGLDAMARLQTETPVAVLLDIEMPRADGFDVAAFMRNTGRLAHTPIIMITSRSGEKHRERARALGVNRYLIKPYQEDQLMSELRSVIAEAAAVQP